MISVVPNNVYIDHWELLDKGVDPEEARQIAQWEEKVSQKGYGRCLDFTEEELRIMENAEMTPIDDVCKKLGFDPEEFKISEKENNEER